MRTLRVLLEAPPAADRSIAWVLVDDRDRVIERGNGVPSQWPPADRSEAVVAASAVRVLGLDLPPLPANRLEQAVTYALEERLATPLDTSLVVAGPQGTDGRIAALVVARSFARAMASHVPPFARIVAEPMLAQRPPAGAWRWCATADHGFVVTDSGEAFAVEAHNDGTLPVELKIALEQAARAGRAPERIVASVDVAPATPDEWARAAGLPFEAGAPWRWDVGDGASADDLSAAFARSRSASPSTPARAPSPAFAVALVVAAAGLHVAATAGTWGWYRMDLAQTQRALDEVARAAGASDADDLRRRHAAAKHRAGQTVPQDAWPRLAQAAPALAALPPGLLRTARYSAGAWTLDLGTIDDTALAAFEARLRGAGLTGVAARTPAGVRIRVEGDV